VETGDGKLIKRTRNNTPEPGTHPWTSSKRTRNNTPKPGTHFTGLGSNLQRPRELHEQNQAFRMSRRWILVLCGLKLEYFLKCKLKF
jgi:hypothetical protein